MARKLILFLLVIVSFLGIYQSINRFFEKQEIISVIKQDKDAYLKQTNNEVFALLEIPKINLSQPIYQLNSSKNNVNQNIQLLKETTLPNEANSEILLASHSGNGNHSFFKNLDQLVVGDTISFIWQQEQYIYEYIEKTIVPKIGTVTLPNYNFKHLILITCSKNDDSTQEIYLSKLVTKKSLN